jgi:outer membrane protein OmpA-like peptidoglycan-associated protein
MRSSAGMIATAACTAFLMPMFSPAAAAAMPKVNANEEATAVSAADPAPAMTAALFQDAMTAPAAIRYTAPRVELFVGYSYLRAVPSIDSANRLVWLNGGSTSVAFNLNRYLGLVGDFGGFNDTELNVTGTSSSHALDSSGTVFTYLAGPRLSFRQHNRITPFAQVLFGGIHASAVTLSDCTGACTLLPSENSFAMTAGVGLDVKVRQHLAIRVVQAEYLMTRFEDRTTGDSAMQNDMRLSSGIVFRFGGSPHLPERALTYSCSVDPSSAYPGDGIAVSGTAVNLNPSRTAVYTWTVDGGTVTGTSNTAKIDTLGLAVGAYTLKGHVSEGGKPYKNADCTAPYAVKAFEPPTVSCSASPSTMLQGGTAAITAIGVSPQNRPLTYTYSSSAGTVSGTGASAVFSSTGAPTGIVTVTCNVADDKGQNASAGTPVSIEAPAVAPMPATSEQCSVHFDRDSRRPARVDNEAKACLDQIALSLQSSSDAKLAIVGNVSSAETADKNLAAERAVNTKAYLVGEKGVDASRIAVYTGSQDGKLVSTVLIPAGATFDGAGDSAVDEGTVKARPRTQKH